MRTALKALEAVERYCILHGWQSLPEHLPSDLDIVVAPEDLPKLEQKLLWTDGARLVNLLRHESTCYYFVLAVEDGKNVFFLPIDAAIDYRRDGRVWFTAEELLEGRRRWKGFWVASPEVEFKYLLVKKILKQSVLSHAGARLQELAEELGATADEAARRLLGPEWGALVMGWIRTGEWEALEGHLPTLKQVLKWERFKQDPLNPLRYWLPEIKRVWQRWRHPTGLWVAVLGPDGSGKSTLIANLEKDLKGAFRRTVRFHLMPGLLRRRGDAGPVTDPHGKPPRSLPTSLLKLLYYLLDYKLGYWLKVRPALVRSTLVLFDRYYDDLLIDPKRYRYGGPMGLTRWLRRFIPRPDLFLVLDVPVEKLLERKREVEPEELQRQVEAYRRFALETPNAFLLDGSLPPEEVAREAREILLDVLHARYLNRRRIWFPQAAEREEEGYIERSLGLRISKGRPTHALLSLPDGRGYFPPLNSKSAFRRGLELYPAQGRKARLGKAVLGALARVGLKGPGLPKVCLEEKEDCVFQTLRKVFGRDDLCFAVSLGTPGPHRKPVIQVLTPEGEVLGYAKVGWNEATRELVKHEAEVLKRLGKEELPFRVPEILYANESSGRNLCLQSPPPKDGRPAPRRWTREYAEVLCALASLGVRYKPLEQTAFWQQIVSRVHEVRSLYWRRVLEQAMERVRRDWKDKEVPLHPAHGDFAPWNTLQADGRLYLYDWEYALEEAPAGYDLIHFVVQTLWLVERHVPEEIARTILQYGEEEFQQVLKWLNVENGSLQELLKLYVLEKLSFYSVSEPGDSKQLRLFWTLFQGLG